MYTNSTELTPLRKRDYFLFILSILGICLGGWSLYVEGMNILLAKQSTTWPSVQGVIKKSSVGCYKRGKGGRTYYVKIYYDYTINEKSFWGRRVYFVDYGTTHSNAQKIVDKYQEGKVVTVYYNPQDPRMCVLEPGITAQAWFVPGVCIFCIGWGIFYMIFFLIQLNRRWIIRRKSRRNTKFF